MKNLDVGPPAMVFPLDWMAPSRYLLKRESYRHLQLPLRILTRRRDLAEISVLRIRIRVRELRCICHVKGLGAKLCLHTLRNGKVLEERNISLCQPGAMQIISAYVPVRSRGRLVERRGIEPVA